MNALAIPIRSDDGRTGDVEGHVGADGLKSLLEAYERRLILSALSETGGVQADAAARLGVKRTTLFEKIRRLGIRSDLLPPIPRSATLEALEGTEFTWRGQLPLGACVEVHGLSGTVTVARSADDVTRVTANRRGGRRERAAINVAESDRGIALTVVRPDPDRGPAPPRRRLSAVRVDFHLAVATGVGVLVRLVTGDIRVAGLDGPLDARTANGRLQWVPAAPDGPRSGGSAAGERALAQDD